MTSKGWRGGRPRFGASWPILAFTIGAAAAIVVLHRSNIRRLLSGEELRASLRIRFTAAARRSLNA